MAAHHDLAAALDTEATEGRTPMDRPGFAAHALGRGAPAGSRTLTRTRPAAMAPEGPAIARGPPL
jgi:hypothetical protein